MCIRDSDHSADCIRRVKDQRSLRRHGMGFTLCHRLALGVTISAATRTEQQAKRGYGIGSHAHCNSSPPPRKKNDHKSTLTPPRVHRLRQQTQHPGVTTTCGHGSNSTCPPTPSRALFTRKVHDMKPNTVIDTSSFGKRRYENITSPPLPPFTN